MKSNISLILFFLAISSLHADSIDYWHVYINDSVVAKYNANSTDLNLTLKKSEIKSNDTITVRYGKDTPCSDCYYVLTLFLEIMEKSPTAVTSEPFGNLSIPMKAILDIQRKYKKDKFYFNYYEKPNAQIGLPENSKLVLVLNITE
ncbi:MAG: hypothetical protein R2852_06825 [Bacteroidia bacterium]